MLLEKKVESTVRLIRIYEKSTYEVQRLGFERLHSICKHLKESDIREAQLKKALLLVLFNRIGDLLKQSQLLFFKQLIAS